MSWSVVAISLMAAGCAQQLPMPAPPVQTSDRAVRPAAAGPETVLYRFQGGKDGANPEPLLTNVSGVLYGTTLYGGGAAACSAGCGTVFKISSSGSGYSSMYAFKGGPSDGQYPGAGFLQLGSLLYGTTQYGGGASACAKNNGCGTVYSIGPTGTSDHVLHAFQGGTEGVAPSSELVAVGSTLYGTTFFGGSPTGCAPYHLGCGTIFSMTTAGVAKTAFRFAGGSDASSPLAPLIAVNGVLYGTSLRGGGTACGGGGCGTIFSFDPVKGTDKVLFTFLGGTRYPSGLVNVNGVLYGTASGEKNNTGEVFRYSIATGKVSYAYVFKGGSDGSGPSSGLTAIGNDLYGVTQFGGGQGCATSYSLGCGTVYHVTIAGAENVVYAFAGGSDGSAPQNGLTAVNGMLYGTTYQGGGTGCQGGGCGTVYSVKP
ncbi:MAG: hypothetical protein JO199_08830 [Candidatus Eremiobacteraeota bacterium]|nr:hypothetical protein [Candidatus Eremiobacteraeota bacterium]